MLEERRWVGKKTVAGIIPFDEHRTGKERENIAASSNGRFLLTRATFCQIDMLEGWT